ncbi:hypothetical protein [Kitasatospora phosalacinea]|uniref:DUF2591 domain-containing protein n=1 Tax=Kitasatospora phosalacinea TaxID=2065 RepID=A0ABW6GS54_9ACTN
MTPEQTLTAAAQKLRAAATAASPGPWTVNDTTYPESIHDATGRDIISGSRWGGEARIFDEDADATWTALAHPGVGLALADWLDTAARYASRRPADHQTSTPFLAAALAVARQILGDQP